MENKNKMPLWMKICIPIGIILLILAMLVGSCVGSYNNMIALQENCTTKQANIQTSLQSRLDKINELMPSVQGYMDHESQTFKDVTALRSNTSGVEMDSSGKMTILSSASIQELQQVDSVTSSLVRDINVNHEAYPELQSSDLMSDFMVSVEGVENRLRVARDNYNEAVQEDNTTIRKFPNSIIAGIGGFEKMDKYQASAEAQNAPKVEFNSNK